VVQRDAVGCLKNDQKMFLMPQKKTRDRAKDEDRRAIKWVHAKTEGQFPQAGMRAQEKKKRQMIVPILAEEEVGVV